MKRWVKGLAWVALAAGVVAVGLPPAATALQERKSQRHVAVPIAAVTVRSDAAALERGHYLFVSRSCAVCHGADGAGRVFIDEPGGLHAKAPNISSGSGTVVGDYSAAAWEHVIRHGVKPDGTPLLIMPSEDFSRLSDDDVGALIGYAQTLPPAPGTGAELRLPMIVKLLYSAGVVKDAAEKIDHSLASAQPVVSAVSVENGRYVATMCIGCHGAHFSGGKIPGGPPDWPAAANLTPGSGSAMAHYRNAAEFAAMLASGKRPDGSAVSSVMPFAALGQLSRTDTGALYLFLAGLQPLPAGQR